MVLCGTWSETSITQSQLTQCGKFQDTERFLIHCERHFSSRLPPSGGTWKYAKPPSTKKTWRDSLPIDMLLSAVSVLVVAQSISEILEGLMNNPVSYHIIQTQQRTSECPLTVTRPHLWCAADHTLPYNASPDTVNYYTTVLHYLHNRLCQYTVISPLLEPGTDSIYIRQDCNRKWYSSITTIHI